MLREWHCYSISLCQIEHVHLKETVVAASECSIEELRPRQSPVPAYLLTTSLSLQAAAVFWLSRPARPIPRPQSAPGRHM